MYAIRSYYDIDPAIVPFIMENEKLSPKEMDGIMNKKSGVLGITEKFIDRRDVYAGYQSGDERCTLALEMECYKIRKYIGAYTAARITSYNVCYTKLLRHPYDPMD